MILDARDMVRQWREDTRGVDLDAIMQSYCDGYADYEGENFYSDDDDESLMKKAEFLADDKEKSSIPGTMDAQSYWHYYSSDEENIKMDIEGGPSEPSMETVGKKMEKRKSQEDGVESEQNDGIEISIELKKKKDFVSKIEV